MEGRLFDFLPEDTAAVAATAAALWGLPRHMRAGSPECQAHSAALNRAFMREKAVTHLHPDWED